MPFVGVVGVLLTIAALPCSSLGPSGFSLAYLEKQFDDQDNGDGPVRDEGARAFFHGVRRDDVLSDAKCVQNCNSDLSISMDMVNAHMAFGSIDVPSVVSARDLWLFCEIDRRHSRCLDECGYSVQFNLREYVCHTRYAEMVKHIPCYTTAAPHLARRCRGLCGGVRKLQHTPLGYATRCRQLLCDHMCTNGVIADVCGPRSAAAAIQFLLDFSRLQIEYWLRDYARKNDKSLESIYPASCSRLQCNHFQLVNCTKGYLG